jgi:hypothetical protein
MGMLTKDDIKTIKDLIQASINESEHKQRIERRQEFQDFWDRLFPYLCNFATKDEVRQIVREETQDLREDVSMLKSQYYGLKMDISLLKEMILPQLAQHETRINLLEQK